MPPPLFEKLLQFQGRELVITEVMRQHAEHPLCFALSRFGADVRRVTVELSDLRGPGGGGKNCRIDVAFRKSESAVIENFDTDLHAAISRAAQKAGRAVSRSLAQLKDLDRVGKPRRGGGGQ